ncbi:glycoside hydrolase family 18 protein [Xanthocytophaga agilis]|uniref:chitinase n=1 Tax=Xanthocytophaga agilis TaxID=3048010 RepID=A0AAE3UC66_9BACT|nr:glycoside hydrolase family 18 protein [Xanthocytophaga agilis]MDJ1499021.1 glycoside hydrolase family 18 protein [Xanthocytophaga agilis]
MHYSFIRFSTIFVLAGLLFTSATIKSHPPKNNFTVIAYYAGSTKDIDQYPIEKLTHIIFSFLHLKGNKFTVDKKEDTLTIQHLVALKKRNPNLKIQLSLGGWGGCETCSQVFSTPAARQEFAESVKAVMIYFKTDGIDLDWEYPAIEGVPGHQYLPADKDNFTDLVQRLRTTMGNKYEISFAAGGFTTYLEQSIDWKKVMPLVDRVNLMTYDLTNGYSTTTGHHTPLYSTSVQKESTDNAVKYLEALGVPKNKLVIGAAFYGRIFENVAPENNGLNQSTKFKHGVDYKGLPEFLAKNKNFHSFWDSTAQSPYMYDATQKLFFTYDDPRSIQIKTKYALDKKLNGIMFWELNNDVPTGGLLDAIDKTVKQYSLTKTK